MRKSAKTTVEFGDFGDVSKPRARRAWPPPTEYTYAGLVSVEEYRAILGDQISTDAQIVARLAYLERLSRNIARDELAKLFQ